ncbi:MAG: hypothetical protein R3F61_05960 [Myxococcota bacterium]
MFALLVVHAAAAAPGASVCSTGHPLLGPPAPIDLRDAFAAASLVARVRVVPVESTPLPVGVAPAQNVIAPVPDGVRTFEVLETFKGSAPARIQVRGFGPQGSEGVVLLGEPDEGGVFRRTVRPVAALDSTPDGLVTAGPVLGVVHVGPGGRIEPVYSEQGARLRTPTTYTDVVLRLRSW